MSFKKDMNFADDSTLYPFWKYVYKEAFSDTKHISKTVKNRDLQRDGVDRVITTKNEKIYVDEKLRRVVYNDILLEHISVLYPNGKTGAKGWMHKTSVIDYLAYGWKPTRTVYLFPWKKLQKLWNAEYKQWIKKYGTRKTNPEKNDGYVTVSIPIPTNVLKNNIPEYQKIIVSENPKKEKPNSVSTSKSLF